MTDAHIRRLTVDDLDAFYDVLESVAAEQRWIGTELPVDREARRQREAPPIESGTDVLLGAEMGNDLVGAAGLHQVVLGLFEVGMFIRDGFRGRGIGNALMERSLEVAREMEAYKLSLQVWPHNEPALRLYEKFGFEREGYLKKQWRRRNGELWDAVVMGLVLD